MTSLRSSLLVAALSVGSAAWSQGAPVGATNLVTDDAKANPTNPVKVDTTEPRILRGNDKVLGPAKPGVALDGPPITFNFEEAPITEVVRTILGDILRVDYALHPPLSGAVTLSTRQPVPPDQAVFLLESALFANGLAMARDARGTYHVGRPDALRHLGSAVRQAGSGPLPPGSGAIVVPLQFIGAGEMATILRPMVPGDAILRVDNVRNLLVLGGNRTQAEAWLDMIATFDIDLLKGMSVGVFPLKHASIKEVEAALRLMSPGGAAAAPAAATTAPGTPGTPGAAPAASSMAALAEGNPLFGALRILPIERLNSILVVTPRAAYLDEARRWIDRLDRPSDNSAEPQLFVYSVQNGNARHLATVLSGIFGGQTTGAPGTTGVAPGLGQTSATSLLGGNSGLLGGGVGGFGGGSVGGFGGNTGGVGFRTGTQGSTFNNNQFNRTGTQGVGQAPVVANLGSVRVMADDINNAVLVWGPRTEYNKIEATLKRLDLPPTQVLIEASIIEVSLNDDLRYGLQWAFTDSRAKTDYTGSGVLSGVAGGVLGGAASGFSYTLRNSLGQVRAVLNALAEKSLVKVISSPSLMVLDNHTASISVGNQQPVKAGESTSTEGTIRTTNIQYKDTGVNLVVTPSVNSGNIVTMQVDQTVTDVGAVDEATGQRAFLQRQIGSKVAVRSGETLVLGGLIRDNATSGKSGIPLLQDVPVVGNLFSTNTVNEARTELLVVITPRVVRSDQEMRDVSTELRERMRGLSDRKPLPTTVVDTPPEADRQPAKLLP